MEERREKGVPSMVARSRDVAPMGKLGYGGNVLLVGVGISGLPRAPWWVWH